MLKHQSIASKNEKERAFNAMLLRNKALIWHISSDYSLGKVWKIEDCMQEIIVNLKSIT